MYKLIHILMLGFFLGGTGIHDTNIPAINGGIIDFSSFKGKQLLLVNINSTSAFMPQLQALQQLQQRYDTTLVVVAFPSSSFVAEPLNDTLLRQKLTTDFHVSFPVAAISAVKGEQANAVYKYLYELNSRGISHLTVKGDFQKILLDKDGLVKGIFKPQVNPLASELTNAIENK